MSEQPMNGVSQSDILKMAADIVSAYVSQNSLDRQEVPILINQVARTLVSLDGSISHEQENSKKPAVSVKKSITPDYLICLEDGKQLKMLKRHLRTAYNMTPEEYRARWNLPPDYPMVAPNYAEKRSQFAKKIGLGKKAK